MIDGNADVVKGSHHILPYSMSMRWTYDDKRTEYVPVYDGLVLTDDDIEALASRIRWSLEKGEPVMAAVFIPKHKRP